MAVGKMEAFGELCQPPLAVSPPTPREVLHGAGQDDEDGLHNTKCARSAGEGTYLQSWPKDARNGDQREEKEESTELRREKTQN